MNWWRRMNAIKVLPPLDAYNSWATSYFEESNPIKDLSDDLVSKFLPDLRGKVVLDAGCGTGKFCLLAEQQNASAVLGIDLSPAMLEVARSHCKSTHFECGDISSIAIKEMTYDVILCALVLGHLERLSPSLDSLLNALKKNGELILTDFHPIQTLLKSKRTFHDRRSGKYYEVLHHLHLFEAYFSCFRQHDAVVEMFEEPLFKGSPAVFGMRIRKL